MKNDGLIISEDNKEVLVKGSKEDLLELANYIKGVALSNEEKDHIHLDDLTLLSKDSEIKQIIIEKE